MIRRFRKKPIIIEAMQFIGLNYKEIEEFVGKKLKKQIHWSGNGYNLIIPTLEGNHEAINGDYIIKGIKDEFYPCKEDIFEMTYEEVKNKNKVIVNGKELVEGTKDYELYMNGNY